MAGPYMAVTLQHYSMCVSSLAQLADMSYRYSVESAAAPFDDSGDGQHGSLTGAAA